MKAENFTETGEINEIFDLFTYNKVKSLRSFLLFCTLEESCIKWIVRVIDSYATVQLLIQITLMFFSRWISENVIKLIFI